jgi:hypothetical protein
MKDILSTGSPPAPCSRCSSQLLKDTVQRSSEIRSGFYRPMSDLAIFYVHYGLPHSSQGPNIGSQPSYNLLAGSYQYSRLSIESEIRPFAEQSSTDLLSTSSNHVMTSLLRTSVILSFQHTPVFELLFICHVYTFSSQALLLDSMENRSHNHHLYLP